MKHDEENCPLCHGSGFMNGVCGHYYDWEWEVSSDEQWTADIPTRVIDSETGQEIAQVVRCNTATGELDRLQVDEDDHILTDMYGEVIVVQETRQIRVEYARSSSK